MLSRRSPNFRSYRPRSSAQVEGFTLAEVMVAMCLVLFTLVGIYTMQAQSVRIVQAGHDSSAASQVLQQRIEQIRATSFDTMATASGLTTLMNGAAGTTPAEQTMTAVKNFQETVKVSTYARPGATSTPAPATITVIRSGNTATSSGVTTNLSAESQVKVNLLVAWTDRQGSHQREFTSVLSRNGLSAAGIRKSPETATTPLP